MMLPNDVYVKMIEDIEDYAILFLDKEGNILSWNKGAEKIKGYKQEEVIGKNFKIFYTVEDQKNNLPQKLIAEATVNGKAIYEGWRVRKDKTMFWGSIVVSAVYTNEKIHIGFAKVTRDLTEKKQIEDKVLQFNYELEQKVKEQNAELYKNEKRFRALVENNYESISLRDAKGKLLYQSQGTDKMIGYTFEEVKDIRLTDICHPDDRTEIEKRIGTSIQNPGKPIYGIHRVRHKLGHYIWMEGTLTNMLDDENVQAMVGNFRDITERKEAEEKIIQANRLYAFVSAVNQTIVYVKDEQTLYNEACRIAVEIGKYDTAWISFPDEVTKRQNIVACNNISDDDLKFFDSVPFDENGLKEKALASKQYYVVNDINNLVDKTNAQVYAEQRKFNSYITLPIIKSGITIGSLNLNSVWSNKFDEQEIGLLQEITGDISFALDVFENEKRRNIVEEKIKHSELRLKQAQAIAHFGSWEMNLATGIGIWSEETCRIYGLDTKDNIQSYGQWLSFVHPEDIHYVKKVTHQNQVSLSGSAFFHRIIRKDGIVRYVYSQSEIEFRNEIAVSLYGVVHDITNMKLIEKALQLSMSNLNLILDLIPQSVYVKTHDGKFIFVNKSFAALYGLCPEELINKKINETIPDNNDSDFFIEQDREILKTGNTKIIPEIVFIDNTGKRRIFFTIKVPYVVPGTNEGAILGISQDITEQKNTEAERTKMIADIIQRNKDLEQFSYIISHNLRAPLANIIGIANLFETTEPNEEDAKTLIGEISIMVEKLDNVIRDINYILQIRNPVNENREQIKFSMLLADIQVSLSNLLKDANIKIISNFYEVDEVFSIKTYLYSIFFNLISNSIKYRREGVQPTIEITSHKDGDCIVIIFKDNGLGIDLKRKGEYIFGLYKRFHYHVEGKGIGLYMVKTQVETLGGKISVESEVNVGTTFKIVFGNSILNPEVGIKTNE